MNYAGDQFELAGGCPSIRAYDAASASGLAVVTHRYKAGARPAVAPSSSTGTSTLRWTTIWIGFCLFDMWMPSAKRKSRSS